MDLSLSLSLSLSGISLSPSLYTCSPGTTADHRAAAAGKTQMFSDRPQTSTTSSPYSHDTTSYISARKTSPEPPQIGAAVAAGRGTAESGHLRWIQAHHSSPLTPATTPRPRDGPDDAGKRVRRHHSHRDSPPRPSVTFLDFFLKLPWGFCSPLDFEHIGTNHVKFDGETKPESLFEDPGRFGRTPSARPNAISALVRA